MENTFLQRIDAFARLGEILKIPANYGNTIRQVMARQSVENSWFIPSFIQYALTAIAEMLSAESLEKMQQHYASMPNLDLNKQQQIAVISAGNIPVAAFHDFFSVLVSGNCYMGKLSSHDKLLLPMLAQILIDVEPSFKDRIAFVEKVSGFDKIIATGSNNSARYFDYYFGKYPHILRKNRNSLAVLSGNESDEQLLGLYHDTFLYFGLGCRSVSMLYLPKGYDFSRLINIANQEGKEVAMHNHYLNNIDFQKTMYLMNKVSFIDAGIALLVERKQLNSPIGIIHIQYYNSIEEPKQFMHEEQENIQCVISEIPEIADAIPFGKAQHPGISDFADHIDTIVWAAS